MLPRLCSGVNTYTPSRINNSNQESLREISRAVPGLCPTPIGYGPLSSSSGYFFLCTFHNLSSSTNPKAQAAELAKLHSYTSPNGKYGFHVPTCCGSTKMPNDWESSWSQFFEKTAFGRSWKTTGETTVPTLRWTSSADNASSKLSHVYWEHLNRMAIASSQY